MAAAQTAQPAMLDVIGLGPPYVNTIYNDQFNYTYNTTMPTRHNIENPPSQHNPNNSTISTTDTDTALRTLITANHILHHTRVLDGYGHISVRNPTNTTTFFISHNVAPAMITSASDLLEFRVSDGSPVDPDSKIRWSERYIHSEIYKRFAAIHCVVHSHAGDVLPFTISGVPLRSGIHMAGFLGTEVPVWDIQGAYSAGANSGHDMLVRDTQLGASLAGAFSKTETATNKIYNRISSTITGAAPPEPSGLPDHPAVLMRGHGITIAGRSVEEAVYQAVYTLEAAKTQITSLLMSNAYFEAKIEGRVDVEGGGKIKGGKIKSEANLHYLSEKECVDTWAMNAHSVKRPWALWEREVGCNPLYVNEMKKDVEKSN
jgi:ribulose-5-phosphate 4-epimerase/fuculose-1-phosphate aldolase